VLVEVASVRRLVRKVGLMGMSEKVVLVLLAIEAGAVKKGSGFLPSRWVLLEAVARSGDGSRL
jgi:hypothetical protein